jgi:hypothetical protein
MRKHAVLFTLTALEMAGLALSAFFWFVMRRDLLDSYRGGPSMSAATDVALSAWFVPAAGAVGGLLVLASWVPAFRTRTRTFLAATGLVCTVFGLTFAIWASYSPAFEQLGPSATTEVFSPAIDMTLHFRTQNIC